MDWMMRKSRHAINMPKVRPLFFAFQRIVEIVLKLIFNHLFRKIDSNNFGIVILVGINNNLHWFSFEHILI